MSHEQLANEQIIRAWKNEAYRAGLSADEQARIPASPVGAVELADIELAAVAGGNTQFVFTFGCCTSIVSAITNCQPQ